MSPVIRQQTEPAISVTEALQSTSTPSVTNKSVVSESVKLRFDRIGTRIGDCVKRYFSAAAAFARMKVMMFGGLLTFLGLGFMIKGLSASTTDGNANLQLIEFILDAPGIVQTIGAVSALVYLVWANQNSRKDTNQTTTELLKIAANPDTPEAVRDATLKKIASM